MAFWRQEEEEEKKKKLEIYVCLQTEHNAFPQRNLSIKMPLCISGTKTNSQCFLKLGAA